MCGLLGVYSNQRVDSSVFSSSLKRLSHRGPDNEGVWQNIDGNVFMGHRRLSIIDLSSDANQPMIWNDRYIIIFNGEIYNYQELKIGLEKKGFRFNTKSDTEVFVALYELEGPRVFNLLNGMWAVVIYDKVENSFVLSRDRMGEKPLFYAITEHEFIFASEMKAIVPFLKGLNVNKEVYRIACGDVFSYESTQECLFQGIKRFPAASYGIYKNNSLVINTFWTVLDNLQIIPSKYETQVEMFRELFIDSCRLRMRSDVPIGTALSGGIDSSATISTIASIAKMYGIKDSFWQHAFVASFPGSSIDETKEAKEVTDFLNIQASFINIDPLLDIGKLEYYTYLCEELYLTSPLPFIQLYKKIKESGTTVTLDGHGGDELFGGYPFDIKEKISDDFPSFSSMLKTINTIEQMSNSSVNAPLFKKYYDLTRKYISYVKNGRSNLKKANPSLDYLNNKLHKSTFTTVLPTLLRNYDRYSMINGVEVRMPFLDHRIVAFAFSIPSDSKVRNGFSKAIVRDALQGFFPDRIRLLKRKTGFNSPFAEWIRGPLKEWILDEIHSSSFSQSNLINQSDIREKVNDVLNNKNASFADGELAWISFMPYIWEKSLKYYS